MISLIDSYDMYVHTHIVYLVYCVFLYICIICVLSLSFCLCFGNFCHQDKFLACVNIIANKSHSDSMTVII